MRSPFRYAGIPNLYIREGTYFYRLQLSAFSHPHLGPREVRRSLRTGNIKIARLRCALADLLVKKLIVNTEKMMIKNISPDALKMARDYFENELELIMDQIEFQPNLDPTLDINAEIIGAVEVAGQYRQMAVDHKFSPAIQYDVDECYKSEGKTPPPRPSDGYREVGVLVSRARAELTRVYHAHLTGQFDQTEILDPIFMPVQSTIQQNALSLDVLTLSEAIERHRAFNKDGIKVGSQKDYDRVYNWMIEWFGAEGHLHKLTKKDVRSFKDMLSVMPKNYSKLEAYKNMTLKDVIDKSKKTKDGNIIVVKTQKKYFSLVTAFLSWAVNDGYLESSPATGINISKKGKKGKDRDR